MTLNLSPSSISENGGSSRITASLSAPSSELTTVTLAAAPGAGADSGDYTLSGTTLTIAPGATDSASALTVSAIDNPVDAPDKTVSISGGAENAAGATDPGRRHAHHHRRRLRPHRDPQPRPAPPSSRTEASPTSPPPSAAPPPRP